MDRRAALSILSGAVLTTAFSTPSLATARETVTMDDAIFWAIIERTLPYETDPDAQVAALARELAPLSADEVVGFANAFEKQLRRAYRWDLWAVDYIAHGGASDDAFEYFRRWLIAKGRVNFERLLASPDDLPEVVGAGRDGPLEFEEYPTTAWTVWAGKTGRQPAEIPQTLDFMTDGSDPAGDPFSEDEATLAARFPKTWARWGENPIY